MTIDPRIGAIISVLAAIISVLLLCGAEFTTLFGGITTTKILAALGIFNAIVNGANGVLHMIPSQNNPNSPQKFWLGPSVAQVAKVAGCIIAVFLLLPLLFQSAHAQGRRIQAPPLALTGDPVQDIKTDLGIKPTIDPVTGKPVSDICDFNLFTAMSPKTFVPQIQACVSNVNMQFLPDIQGALDSATAAQDKPGIDCLTPVLAIVKAAVGTPAVDPVAAVPASGTTPAVAAVAGVPAKFAGVITLFQKYREFTLANGPTACKNWVQSTINNQVAGAL
jgi:hypothetical protein